MEYKNMTREELIKQVDDLEHKKMIESKRVFEVNKEFNILVEELQKAKAELYNKRLKQNFITRT